MASVLEDALQNLGASAHCPRDRALLPRRSNHRKNEQSDVFAYLVADVSPFAGTVILAKQQLCPTRIGSGVRLRPPKFDTNTSCFRPAGLLGCSWAGPRLFVKKPLRLLGAALTGRVGTLSHRRDRPRTPQRVVPTLNGFFIFLTASAFVADGRTGDWTTGTRNGLDKTKVRPSLRRIFAGPDRPPCPPLTIGSISGRMSWLQFIIGNGSMQKACRGLLEENLPSPAAFLKKQCLIIMPAPYKLTVCWTGK